MEKPLWPRGFFEEGHILHEASNRETSVRYALVKNAAEFAVILLQEMGMTGVRKREQRERLITLASRIENSRRIFANTVAFYHVCYQSRTNHRDNIIFIGLEAQSFPLHDDTLQILRQIPTRETRMSLLALYWELVNQKEDQTITPVQFEAGSTFLVIHGLVDELVSNVDELVYAVNTSMTKTATLIMPVSDIIVQARSKSVTPLPPIVSKPKPSTPHLPIPQRSQSLIAGLMRITQTKLPQKSYSVDTQELFSLLDALGGSINIRTLADICTQLITNLHLSTADKTRFEFETENEYIRFNKTVADALMNPSQEGEESTSLFERFVFDCNVMHPDDPMVIVIDSDDEPGGNAERVITSTLNALRPEAPPQTNPTGLTHQFIPLPSTSIMESSQKMASKKRTRIELNVDEELAASAMAELGGSPPVPKRARIEVIIPPAPAPLTIRIPTHIVQSALQPQPQPAPASPVSDLRDRVSTFFTNYNNMEADPQRHPIPYRYMETPLQPVTDEVANNMTLCRCALYEDLQNTTIMSSPTFQLMYLHAYLQENANKEEKQAYETSNTIPTRFVEHKNKLSRLPRLMNLLLLMLTTKSTQDADHLLDQLPSLKGKVDYMMLNEWTNLLKQHSLVFILVNEPDFLNVAGILAPDWFFRTVQHHFQRYELLMAYNKNQESTLVTKPIRNLLKSLNANHLMQLEPEAIIDVLTEHLHHVTAGQHPMVFGDPETVHQPRYLDDLVVGAAYFIEMVFEKILLFHHPDHTTFKVGRVVREANQEAKAKLLNQELEALRASVAAVVQRHRATHGYDTPTVLALLAMMKNLDAQPAEYQTSAVRVSPTQGMYASEHTAQRWGFVGSFYAFCHKLRHSPQETVLGRCVQVFSEIIYPQLVARRQQDADVYNTNKNFNAQNFPQVWGAWPRLSPNQIDQLILSTGIMDKPKPAAPLVLGEILGLVGDYLRLAYHPDSKQPIPKNVSMSSYSGMTMRLLFIQIHPLFVKNGDRAIMNTTLMPYFKRLYRVAFDSYSDFWTRYLVTKLQERETKTRASYTTKLSLIQDTLSQLTAHTQQLVGSNPPPPPPPSVSQIPRDLKLVNVIPLIPSLNLADTYTIYNRVAKKLQKTLKFFNTQVDIDAFYEELKRNPMYAREFIMGPFVSEYSKREWYKPMAQWFRQHLLSRIEYSKALLGEPHNLSVETLAQLSPAKMISTLVVFWRPDAEGQQLPQTYYGYPFLDSWADFWSLQMIRSATVSTVISSSTQATPPRFSDFYSIMNKLNLCLEAIGDKVWPNYERVESEMLATNAVSVFGVFSVGPSDTTPEAQAIWRKQMDETIRRVVHDRSKELSHNTIYKAQTKVYEEFKTVRALGVATHLKRFIPGSLLINAWIMSQADPPELHKHNKALSLTFSLHHLLDVILPSFSESALVSDPLQQALQFTLTPSNDICSYTMLRHRLSTWVPGNEPIAVGKIEVVTVDHKASSYTTKAIPQFIQTVLRYAYEKSAVPLKQYIQYWRQLGLLNAMFIPALTQAVKERPNLASIDMIHRYYKSVDLYSTRPAMDNLSETDRNSVDFLVAHLVAMVRNIHGQYESVRGQAFAKSPRTLKEVLRTTNITDDTGEHIIADKFSALYDYILKELNVTPVQVKTLQPLEACWKRMLFEMVQTLKGQYMLFLSANYPLIITRAIEVLLRDEHSIRMPLEIFFITVVHILDAEAFFDFIGSNVLNSASFASALKPSGSGSDGDKQ